MAIHVHEPGTHDASLDCHICQAYERTALPGLGISTPEPITWVIRAKLGPEIIQTPPKAAIYLPPTRAPPR